MRPAIEQRIEREFGGSRALFHRHKRRLQAKREGRVLIERGTVDEIAKRAAVNRLIRLLRWIAHCRPQYSLDERRAKAAERQRRRYRENPRCAIYHRLKRVFYRHLRAHTESRKYCAALGYRMADLRAHMESRFTDGMGWHNVGEWHVDHIRPVAAFRFASIDDAEFRACYALSNLQPLWSLDNGRKGARI